MKIRYLILDDTSILWSSDPFSSRGEQHASSIMAAVKAGKKKDYEPHLGSTWSGELVLAQEVTPESKSRCAKISEFFSSPIVQVTCVLLACGLGFALTMLYPWKS